MIASIDRKRVLPSFLRGAESEFRNALGVKKVTEAGIQRRFRLAGLFDAMYESLHFAQWRAVGIEARRPIRTVQEHIGFDVIVGDLTGNRVEMRYIPEVRNMNDKAYPLEIASLHVASFINNKKDDETSFHGVPAILSRCVTDKRSIRFEGTIPISKRNYHSLILHPNVGAINGYSFRLE